ncbi:MAG TPA: M23 family metallopeptidase [Vicinamibacteria bacterium]|nr:M23 family metallopeptidase [Vicinamibacteria bacterium]
MPLSKLRLTLLAALALLPDAAHSQIVQKRAGRLSIAAEQTLAYPGGVIVVQLASTRGIRGYATANFDGHRSVFFAGPGGVRALVPIPATTPPGPHTLGIEVRGRGRIRVPLTVEVAVRDYPPRTITVPEAKRPLAIDPRAVRESRELLRRLRTLTLVRLWRGPFASPVAAEPTYSYGAPTTYLGGSPVESRTDGVFGEYHRGMDYQVPEGTPVLAPASGIVFFVGDLPLSGKTLLVDHGQGVVSAFFHLSRVEVAEGQVVEPASALGRSGSSGIAATPHLHWGVYLHGVAVDPRVFQSLTE